MWLRVKWAKEVPSLYFYPPSSYLENTRPFGILSSSFFELRKTERFLIVSLRYGKGDQVFDDNEKQLLAIQKREVWVES